MNKASYRIVCLNLALLFLLSFSVPVYAKEPGEPESPIQNEEALEAPEWAFAGDDYSAARELAERNVLEEKENNPEEAIEDSLSDATDDDQEFLPVLLSSSEPTRDGSGSAYLISVGNTRFLSNEVRSGSGWSYADGKLNLNNYNSSCISASGDLTIYSNGSVTIQGSSGSYGSAGIAAGGLDVIVESGSLRVTGGSGTISGGDAISANSLFFSIWRNCDLNRRKCK